VKVGDLVRRRRQPFVVGWVGLVMKLDEEGFVWVRWLDDGTIDDCSASLMEVISESR
tara:strand:+ start:26 stop:196 length:171 start_codon:yes stop_codon:yes gene_type:complete